MRISLVYISKQTTPQTFTLLAVCLSIQTLVAFVLLELIFLAMLSIFLGSPL